MSAKSSVMRISSLVSVGNPSMKKQLLSMSYVSVRAMASLSRGMSIRFPMRVCRRGEPVSRA